MKDIHSLVYVFYSLGKLCMTLLWIGWCFLFLSSISQISLSPRDGYARGAEISGDTISLHPVAMALVLRAYLFITYETFVFNKMKIKSFIQNSITFKEVFECRSELSGLPQSLSLLGGIFHPPHCNLQIHDSFESCLFQLGPVF